MHFDSFSSHSPTPNAVDRHGSQDRSDAGLVELRDANAPQGLKPSASDLREMHLTVDEKMAAASESGAAIARQLEFTQARNVRATYQRLASAT
jgi:hypothetical protein